MPNCGGTWVGGVDPVDRARLRPTCGVTPVYLVQEVDRFKVITLPELEYAEFAKLPLAMHPWTEGPVTVAIREPKDADERKKSCSSRSRVAATTLNVPSFTCRTREMPPLSRLSMPNR